MRIKSWLLQNHSFHSNVLIFKQSAEIVRLRFGITDFFWIELLSPTTLKQNFFVLVFYERLTFIRIVILKINVKSNQFLSCVKKI